MMASSSQGGRHVGPVPADAAHGAPTGVVLRPGGVIVAGLLFLIVGGAGVASNHASEIVAQGSADIVDGRIPTVSTMVDSAGKPIAWLYVQRRFEVPGDRSPTP